MSEQPRVPAAARYKEITSVATSAAKRMREREREKSAELQELVASGRERLAEADRVHEWTVGEVRERWDAAMETLFEERWLKVTPIPKGSPSAPPAEPEASVNSVQRAFHELYQAVKAPRWSLRKNRGDAEG